MGDCSAMQTKLQEGPGSIVICVNDNFQSYSSGVFDGCSGCTVTNHAVLLYGYTRAGHWRIKNSWGKSWGMNGHMKVKSGNTCIVCQRGV